MSYKVILTFESEKKSISVTIQIKSYQPVHVLSQASVCFSVFCTLNEIWLITSELVGERL